MNKLNCYPVSFKDFLRIKSVGNYTINYAILDDRVHFEMPIENAVYLTQRFITDVKKDIEKKAKNYNGDPVQSFLKMTLSGSTFYRFYPTSKMLKELKSIKLYEEIIVKETKKGTFNHKDLKIVEGEDYLKALDGEDVVLFGEKVK